MRHRGRNGRERSGAPWVAPKFGGTSVSLLERWGTIASVHRERLEDDSFDPAWESLEATDA